LAYFSVLFWTFLADFFQVPASSVILLFEELIAVYVLNVVQNVHLYSPTMVAENQNFAHYTHKTKLN